MNYKNGLRLTIAIIIGWMFVELIRSCGTDPTQNQLFAQLATMRSDMQEIIKSGGNITDYDNNRKTTFARVYLMLDISADSWSDSLRITYTNTLLTRGWHEVKSNDDGQFFCKQGAYASLIRPHDQYGASLTMVFDTSSVMLCHKLSAAN